MRHYCSFSEAIREGAKLRPQGYDLLFRAGASCAVGAGMEALGVDISMLCEDGPDPLLNEINRLYPYLKQRRDVLCPACGRDPYPDLINCIFDLNDLHHWTREQIADWLESEEEKLGFVTVVEGESSRSQTEVSDVVSHLANAN